MQLKHLFVFLLILLISVAESNVYSQENSSNYYQSSKVNYQKKFSAKNTKHVVFNKNILFHTYFLSFFYSSILLKEKIQVENLLTIKLQKQLYQKIAISKKEHIFLISKITASNSISYLYIA